MKKMEGWKAEMKKRELTKSYAIKFHFITLVLILKIPCDKKCEV